ncbi:MAG: CPBP family intramembrane metalloprotease [Candidatus Cloacimonetes bacterium]|nr:CPBP family intramembrane metalloprotease [Candidatus Cloacimonadota bacterium]
MEKPISIFSSAWYFIISSFLIYFGLYYCIPFTQTLGLPFFVGYLIFFYTPFVLLLITVLILYKIEGNKWNWENFTKRTRLRKISGTDWLWTIGLFIFGIIVYAGLSPVGNWLAKLSFFSPPDFFPAEINPNKSRIAGYMMDYKLSGQYWIIPAYFGGWLFNIFGEELLWRGILFPRQIKKYGSRAWIYHGVIWTLWHFFWAWNLLSIFPFAIALSFVAYKRQTTTIPIIAHGLMNLFPLFLIIIEVIK